MVEFNPVMMAIILGLLGVIFFFYLLLRRTVMAYREGKTGNR